jgi:hypothetical protein
VTILSFPPMFLPRSLAACLLCTVTAGAAPAPQPRFEHVTIDPAVQVGYGVDIADVDGDGWRDVLLADKKQFAWYRNPGAGWQDAGQWKKHVLAENLTKNDNVCIAAQDIDGDGKCEVAVGAEWNPGDTVNSGAVFYLVPPADRTQRWEAVKLHAEPTVHRMRWMALPGDAKPAKWGLVVVPLHGRGNKNGEGAGVKVLLYTPPAGEPRGEWKTEAMSERQHMTHNFDPISWQGKSAIVLGSKEALTAVAPEGGTWRETGLANSSVPGFAGVGEVRAGRLTGGNEFFAAVEPMHGNQLAIYRMGLGDWERVGITDQLTEGHALACGDLLGAGSDQIVIGWRGNPKNAKAIGVRMWIASDERGSKWRDVPIDEDGMACEDLKLADLDGDGKLDIVASGRSTKNLKVYLNRSVAGK